MSKIDTFCNNLYKDRFVKPTLDDFASLGYNSKGRKRGKMLKIDLDKNKKYGFAVSGGVDSMVMLELCKKAGLFGVVLTINHGLREESKEEVEFVKSIANGYGYKTIIKNIDCNQYKKEQKVSTELAARLLRYQFFDEVAKVEGLDYILLAHHLDDQVETMILRILRGTGVYGLRGIVDRGIYLHPLIEYTKNDIMGYATANNIEYRQDCTNDENIYRRNTIRNILLPIIEKDYPDYRQSFLRLNNASVEVEDYFSTHLLSYTMEEDGVVFEGDIFDEHKAISKRSIRKALYDIGVQKDFEEKNYDTLFSLKGKESGTTVQLGQGLIARIEYGRLILERQAEEEEEYEKFFSIDEEYCHNNLKYGFCKTNALEKGVTFDIDKVPAGAVVRTRKKGDIFKRFKGGSKSLSDYLTDMKLTKSTRKNLLVLANGKEILAILGVEISDKVKIDDTTKTMVKVVKLNA